MSASLVPAISKIQRRLKDLGLSVNAFERETGLGTGVGSRLLRGEYRPKIAGILRIQAWSDGDVGPSDWLNEAEVQAQAAVEQARTGQQPSADPTLTAAGNC